MNNKFQNFFSAGKAAAEEGSSNEKILVVNINRCPQNHTCPAVRVCPTGALKQNGFAAPTVNLETCIKCGKCVKFCPKRAFGMA